jgi:integrase
MHPLMQPSSTPLGFFPDRPRPRLYDRLIDVLRAHHYSCSTEKAYVNWIKRFLEYRQRTHPRHLDESDVNAFLTRLAVDGNVAASTPNQALSAILFLYDRVLEQPLNRVEGVVRAKKRKRLSVVLTKSEVADVIGHLKGVPRLVVSLQSAGGLRVLEALRVRVKDLDVSRCEMTVRQGKGDKDRRTLFLEFLHAPVETHLEAIRGQHVRDLEEDRGRVPLPSALEKKFAHACNSETRAGRFSKESGMMGGLGQHVSMRAAHAARAHRAQGAAPGPAVQVAGAGSWFSRGAAIPVD